MFALIYLPNYSSDNAVQMQQANIPRFYINKLH